MEENGKPTIIETHADGLKWCIDKLREVQSGCYTGESRHGTVEDGQRIGRVVELLERELHSAKHPVRPV